jgi:UDP-N-acetylmuramate dehydrogenase
LQTKIKLEKGNYEEIESKMKELLEQRRNKQPLEYPSAGSTFKRPEGYYVGKIIEELGLKGFSIGGAQISEKHGGFVINKGNATAKDVKDLIEYIVNEVKKAYNIELEPEVKMI